MCSNKSDKFPIEVKEQFMALIQDDAEIKKLLSINFQEMVISTYNSSFPKAKELNEMEKIHPGITKEMVTMMKKNQNHDINFDNKVLELEKEKLKTIQKEISGDVDVVKRGQYIGGGISIIILFLTWTLISQGNPGYAVSLLLGSGALGALVGAFTGFLSFKAKEKKEEDDDDIIDVDPE